MADHHRVHRRRMRQTSRDDRLSDDIVQDHHCHRRRLLLPTFHRLVPAVRTLATCIADSVVLAIDELSTLAEKCTHRSFELDAVVSNESGDILKVNHSSRVNQTECPCNHTPLLGIRFADDNYDSQTNQQRIFIVYRRCTSIIESQGCRLQPK